MTTKRLLQQSLQSLTRYKLRTSFMMLGSLVGVAALTFVLSISQAAQTKMLRTVRQILGDQAILVVGGGGTMMGGPRSGASRLTLDDVTAIVKEVPAIQMWDVQAERSRMAVRRGSSNATVRVIGESERWEHVWGRGVANGESFDAAAVSGTARVALIGETVARGLFAGEDPIGGEIQIGAVPFRVIGVLERFGVDMHGMDRDNEIVVPISTMMRRVANTDMISGAKLVVNEAGQERQAARDVSRLLRTRHGIAEGQSDDFRIMTSVAVQQMVGTMRRILVLYVPLVGLVALIIGGVVAATLMLSSVSERVAEIGLRRAVGAGPQDIRRQFLVETAATVVLGGLAGIALGVLSVQAASSRMRLDAAVTPAAVVISLLAAALTGLVAGVAPARRAARLDPADALR
ncbi:MAG TPA: ABC transporter permease [Gemmatimonadaceae bacterium]|nr:ABC transporter permease [Gemmatimonadaceae bacterium]